MNKDTNIIFRVNSDLKDDFAAIARDRNVSISELLTACMKDVTFRGKVPLYINRFLPSVYQRENKLTIARIKQIVCESIEKSKKQDLISKVYLYGSYSRGEETEQSDIDLRMEADDALTFIDVDEIRENVVQMTGKDVDLSVAEPKDLDFAFYEKIRKDQICIYER